MHITCPHCHNPIEIVEIKPREEIACPACGSSFHGCRTGFALHRGGIRTNSEFVAASESEFLRIPLRKLP